MSSLSLRWEGLMLMLQHLVRNGKAYPPGLSLKESLIPRPLLRKAEGEV